VPMKVDGFVFARRYGAHKAPVRFMRCPSSHRS
jgi:hypothetical protein